jgi:fucose permease
MLLARSVRFTAIPQKVATTVRLLHNERRLMGTQAIALNSAARQRYLLTLYFAGFFLTGLEITLVGPLLPQFIQRWTLTDSQAGIFFTVQFAASLAGVWLASLLTHYFGARTPLILGYACMGFGLAALNSASMTLVLFALAALGMGYGLVVPPTNLGVAQIGGPKSASLVSLVNFAWGAGAVSCSPLVLIALRNAALRQFLYGFAALGSLLTLAFFFAVFQDSPEEASEARPKDTANVGIVSTVILAALFFLYVGIEVSLGSWAAAHAKRLPHSGAGLATVAPMFFYGGLMVGRALAPLVLARVREYRLVLVALFVVLVGNSLVVLAWNQGVAFGSLSLAGLGCATIFPVYIAWLSRWYGSGANRVSGLMFSMSSLGSAIAPWLVGVVSAHAGGLRIGLLVPLSSAVVMFLLLLIVRRQAAA